MTDIELLKAAAKAQKLEYHIDTLNGYKKLVSGGFIWNPLFDDGQALRLAVTLNIDVLQDTVCQTSDASGPHMKTVSGPWGNDKLAATRRAIPPSAASSVRRCPPRTAAAAGTPAASRAARTAGAWRRGPPPPRGRTPR